MKLYLSSYKIGDKSQELAKMFGENKRVAVIANAMDFLIDKKERQVSVKKEIDALTQLGLEAEEVDLRDYFGKPEELKSKLDGYGGLWVRGGNVFILRRAFSESGMDEWLRSQRNKDLVYAGYSAGVCVLSPNLKGLDLVDDPKNVPAGYQQVVILEGVGLISFSFAPHYKSPGHPETEAVNGLVDYFQKEGIEYRALSDGEVIIEEI